MSKLSAQFLKADHSFKVTKHIIKLYGETLFLAVFTVTNEYGEVRGVQLTFSTNSDEVKDLLLGIERGLQLNGHLSPEALWVDNPKQVKSYYESVFPSLRVGFAPKPTKTLPPYSLPDAVDTILITNSGMNTVFSINCEWHFY